MNLNTDHQELIMLAHTKMPFGKYKGRFLIDLPEFYVVWYSRKGFPQGKLGNQLRMVHEFQINGLVEMIRKIRVIAPNS